MEDDLLAASLGLTPSSPFDDNAGVNLASGQATAPVVSTSTGTSTGTSAASPSFLQSLTSDVSALSSLATPILGNTAVQSALGIKPTTTTTAKPASTSSVSSLLSSPMTLIALIGGGLLLFLLLAKR